MAFFRDDDKGHYKQYFIPETPREMLETARWYHWCGWNDDALALLDKIAMGLEDPTYEETRFNDEEEDTETDRATWD